jgi:hypothetical protein
MAYIRYADGSQEFKPETEAEKLWRILDGQAKPMNEAQRRYCESVRRNVKKVVLNFHTAPEDYIRKNLQKILPQIVANWVVDRRGKPLRPANAEQWAFAKKYGLWKGHRPSALVTGGQQTLV